MQVDGNGSKVKVTDRDGLVAALHVLEEIGAADQVPGHVNYLSKAAMARAARAMANDIRQHLGLPVKAGGAA